MDVKRFMGGSNLFTLSFNSFKNGLVRAVGKAAVDSSLLVFLVPVAEPLGAKVECVAKRLVYASKGLSSGHENLQTNCQSLVCFGMRYKVCRFRTRSNAVEHARGCVATKMGLLLILCSNLVSCMAVMRVSN